VLAGIAIVLLLLAASSTLKLNLTESMPIGLYLLHRTTMIHVGDIVIACPPLAAQRVGMANGYLTRAYGITPGSRCVAGSAPVLKYVIALAGDELVINQSGLALNGQLFDTRLRARIDSHGRRLAALIHGRYRLGKYDIWLYSPAPRGWDSRYFGPIKRSDVLGIAKPIWTPKNVCKFK